MKTKKTNLNVQIPVELYEEIQRIAAKRDITISDVARMCLDIGLSTHRDFERCGLIAVLDFSHYVKVAVKDKLEQHVKGKQLSLPL